MRWWFKNIWRDFKEEAAAFFHDWFYHGLLMRIAVLTVGTVMISMLYKGMIEAGVFRVVHGTTAHRAVFCGFEILLLALYWRGVLAYCRKCRHRLPNLAAYYKTTGIISGIFAVIYGLSYVFMSRDLFTGIFRVTLNLAGFRFRTTFPENLLPCAVAYLAITIALMMFEPYIAKKRYKHHAAVKRGTDPVSRMKEHIRWKVIDKSYELQRRHDVKLHRRRKRRFQKRMKEASRNRE